MTRASVIEAFVKLCDRLKNLEQTNPEILQTAVARNQWFDQKSISQATHAITDNFLQRKNLEEWISSYSYRDSEPKSVGLIMAGNIPLVGFHDLLAVLISGHNAVIKLSDKDTVLMNYVIDSLIEIDSDFSDRIKIVEKLSGFDAVIATGSNTSAAYFEKYFSDYPHIIRKNRHAVGLIHADDTAETLADIGGDIFTYFGLGCRNLSKIYVEKGFRLETIFEIIEDYEEIIHHNKYKNNYDYNHALYLLNKRSFLTNNYLLLLEDELITSRIACLNYTMHDDIQKVKSILAEKADEIQLVLSSRSYPDLPSKPFGYAQSPQLDDYADGVDTMEFLNQLQ